MRRVLFLAFVAILGCGKPEAPLAATAPPPDPMVARREKDATAAFAFDAACATIEEALAATKKLANLADGDAKDALLDVADMLDSSGATLADHNDDPPPLAEYQKKDPAADRTQAIKDALDALQELREASGTLDDLAATVPKEFSPTLKAIQDKTDEALDSVVEGIEALGGKVPPEPEE